MSKVTALAAGAAASAVLAHDQVETFREDVVYPQHAQRKESPLFAQNKRQLVTKLDTPCFTCGSRDAREVHHFIVEWAMWDEVDPAKVLQTAHHFDIYGFAAQMGDMPFESPDDIRNLMVLCGSHTLDGETIEGGHHRGVDCGIHRTTFPTWIGQKIAKDGVTITRALGAPAAHGDKASG